LGAQSFVNDIEKQICQKRKSISWEHQKNAFDKIVMDCRLQKLVKNGKTIVGTTLKTLDRRTLLLEVGDEILLHLIFHP